ncbi:MAG: DUF4962 domain-containing protein [Paucibacter sp.]|nr:DUF4962 domain-containing protein [Roseateles sp.]
MSVAAVTPSGQASGASAATAQSAEEATPAASAAASAAEAVAGDDAASSATATAQAAKLATDTKIAVPAVTPAPAPTLAAAPASTAVSKQIVASPAPAEAATKEVAGKTSTSTSTSTFPSTTPTPTPTPTAPSVAPSKAVAIVVPAISVAVPTLPSAVVPSSQTTAPSNTVITNAQALPSDAPVQGKAPLATPTQTLSGSGIPGLNAACDPKLYTDFIEKTRAELKRLLPSDCRIVADSQPIFSWPQPSNRNKAVAWTFVLKKSDGSTVSSRTSNTPRLLLDAALPQGDYTWSVSYKTAAGVQVQSEARRFSVPAGLANSKLPTGAAFVTTVTQKGHPRLLPAGSSFSAIALAATNGDYKAAYNSLIKEADRSAAAALTAEPALRTRSSFAVTTDYNAAIAAARAAADAEQGRIEALSYAAKLTGSASYSKAALDRVLALAAWDPNGMTSEANQPQANRSVHIALATGLDLLWDKMTAAQRNTVASAVRARLVPVMESIRKIDESPYLSFENTAVYFALRSLLLTTGTPGMTDGNAWLQEAWDAYSTILHDKANQDGSAGGSTAYAWFDFYDHARTLAMLKVTTGVDMTQRAFYKNFGNYLIAMTAPNVDQLNAFGDSVETQTLFKNYAFDSYRLYAAVSRRPEHEWYWRARPENIQYVGVNLSPLHLMLLGTAGSNPSPVAPSQQAWAFPDAGIIASHSKTADSARSSFFFKSSPHGSYNHEHADQNSFTLVSKGRNLLISSGFYDYYNSPHHASVTRSTRYKNAVSYDGGVGQAGADVKIAGVTKPVQSMEPNGRLINYLNAANFTAGTGDASLAYRSLDLSNYTYVPQLNEALRSFVHLRSQGIVVIYDWLSSEAARKWEWNYHALTPFTTKGSSIVANNSPASACIDHYGVPGTFSQTSLWDAAPTTTVPAQHHGRYTASVPSKQVAMVTVIREDCQTTSPVSVAVQGSLAKVTVAGQVFEFDRKAVTTPK